MHLDNNRPLVPSSSSSEIAWQWRPKRWIVTLIIVTIILVVGTMTIQFLPTEYKGESDLIYNFNVAVLLLFALWSVFSEREWPIWKRVLWIIALWLVHGFMQLVLPIALIGPIKELFNSASVASLILIVFAMRRSNFFVESAESNNNAGWLGIW